MRRAARKDANQAEIVDALRESQHLVWVIDEPCDLIVHHASMGQFVRLIEVKDSDKPPSARKLTKKQVETHKRWPVSVVSTVAEALQVVRGGV